MIIKRDIRQGKYLLAGSLLTKNSELIGHAKLDNGMEGALVRDNDGRFDFVNGQVGRSFTLPTEQVLQALQAADMRAKYEEQEGRSTLAHQLLDERMAERMLKAELGTPPDQFELVLDNGGVLEVTPEFGLPEPCNDLDEFPHQRPAFESDCDCLYCEMDRNDVIVEFGRRNDWDEFPHLKTAFYADPVGFAKFIIRVTSDDDPGIDDIEEDDREGLIKWDSDSGTLEVGKQGENVVIQSSDLNDADTSQPSDPNDLIKWGAMWRAYAEDDDE